MRRREFITLFGGAAAAWPLAARAQQAARTRRLGILMAIAEGDPEAQRWVSVFVRGLRELGWTEGANIRIDYRWAGGDVGRIRGAAAELIALKPDVILAQTALALAPLQQMTSTIPFVFLQIVDPVGSGFVNSLARPGGNITGFTPAEFSVAGKMLEVLKEVAPAVNRVAVIYNPVQAPQMGMWNAIATAAAALNVQVSAASAGNVEDIERIIEDFSNEPRGGMIVLPSAITVVNRDLVIALMARHRLPAVYAYPFFVKDGGLVSYGADPGVEYHQAASYVDRILKGAKPADLPVQQPIKFDRTVNLTTAKALGLTIPESFLSLADQVFE
jgi:putative tryptophan/tyrosine transport system substrate-binding protein